MKSQKGLALLLMALLLLQCAAGISAGAESTKPDSWITDDLTLTMVYFEDARMPYNPDWGWVEFFKENTGVTLEIIAVPSADYTAKANTMIASGAPADFFTNCSVFTTYFNDGVWLPISDYWDYMPNFKRVADEADAWKSIDLFREADGKFYNLPDFRAFSVNNLQLFFRKDLMDKYGLVNPTTLDEFTDVLLTLRTNEPDSRGMTFVQGLGPMGGFIERMFNGVPMFGNMGRNGIAWRDEVYTFGPTTDVARGALEWLHLLVEENIMDMETFSMPREQMRTYMSNGQYFANMCYYSDTTVAEGAGVPIFGEEFGYQVCFPPETEYGRAYSTGSNGKWQYTYVVTAYCRQRLGEDKFIDAVRFFDWMRYSEKAWTRHKYGIEGVTFSYVDGEPVLVADYDKEQGGTRNLEQDYGCGVLPFRGYILEIDPTGYTEEYVQYQMDTVRLGYVQEPEPAAKFSMEDQDVINQYWPSLKTYVDEMATKFILGELEINDQNWELYTKECANRGADQILALYEKVAPEGP